MTIYDIAKMAGVSASTVSRVINNKTTVRRETRDRIMSILSECNYVPDETARSLVTQSTKIIGILIADIRTAHHTNGIYYIERELASNGYSCLIYNTGTDERNWEKHIQTLSQRKVDAAVLMGSIYQSETIANAIQSYMPDTPVILCNGCLNIPNVYSLLADERDGVADCMELLKRNGYRRPAFLYDRLTPSTELKCRGFQNGLAQHFPDCDLIIKEVGVDRHDVYPAVCDLLSEHSEIDSMVFSEDLLAIIGLRALADMKRSVPKEIGVVGINNSLYSEICIPTLTSLDNVLYDLSMSAARNVLALLSGQRVSRKMIIYSEIIERESTNRSGKPL